MATKSPPSPAVASRLPSTRESRPALIGLALLLIVGGALASAYLALVAGHRAEFVKIEQDIAQGTKLTEDHLSTVSLPEGYDGGIPADQMDDLVGQFTTVRLLAGTVLSPGMVSDEGGVPEGQVLVELEMGHTLADGLAPGAQLIVDVENGIQVPAELVKLGAVEEGGIGSTSSGKVQVTVQLPSGCNQAVSQGKRDDAVEVSVGSLEQPVGCG